MRDENPLTPEHYRIDKWRRALVILGLLGPLFSLVWTTYSFAEKQFSPDHDLFHEANVLVSIADQLWVTGYQANAIEKYQEALEKDPFNIEAIRRVVFSFQQSKYPVQTALKKQLGDNYHIYFLRLIYQLQALDPKFNKDADLLWKQVYFFEKDRGTMKHAGVVLEKIHELNPDDPEALSKLGLFLVKHSSDSREKERGITSIKQATTLAPKEPKYFQHLGEALEEIGDDVAAILIYKKATQIFEGDAKETSRGREAFAVRGMKIFRQYAEKDKKRGVLTPMLRMSLDERTIVFEYFYNLMDTEDVYYPYAKAMIPGEEYLLTLYSEAENFKKAEVLLARYFSGEGIGKQGAARFIDETFTKNWIEILEQKSPDSTVLTMLRATYEKRWSKKPAAPEKKDRN